MKKVENVPTSSLSVVNTVYTYSTEINVSLLSVVENRKVNQSIVIHDSIV